MRKLVKGTDGLSLLPMLSGWRTLLHIWQRGALWLSTGGGGQQKANFTAQKLPGEMGRKRSLMTPRMTYTTLELWQQIIRLKCKESHKSKKKIHTPLFCWQFSWPYCSALTKQCSRHEAHSGTKQLLGGQGRPMGSVATSLRLDHSEISPINPLRNVSFTC